MILASKLVDDAYKGVGMTGIGNSTIGTRQAVGRDELNRLIANLNSQGFISLSQQWKDASASGGVVKFKKLAEGETAESNVIDMEPPSKVDAVSRKTGNVWLPLSSIDAVQMFTKSQMSLATAFNYGVEFEQVPGTDDMREVGLVRLDGTAPYGVRMFFNSKLPTYELTDKIYLSSLYNDLLLTGLKFYLAKFYELSEQKKADCEIEFSSAKKLIKRNNIMGRMLQVGKVAGGYDDSFHNGMSGAGW